MKARPDRVAIIGTEGVPGGYGGFETLAQNLVDYHWSSRSETQIAVYCSSPTSVTTVSHYKNALLRHLPVSAHGAQSVLYDCWSLFHSVFRGDNKILLLGVSGAMVLPILRVFSSAKFVTNIDGLEWRRQKWGRITRVILKFFELIAVRFSHRVIADSEAIAEYVETSYGRKCDFIAYGGDHAVSHDSDGYKYNDLPDKYALALCRVEPENNVAMILEAFSKSNNNLVFVGNWGKGSYGKHLRQLYSGYDNIFLLDPVFDPRKLRSIRDHATVYVHGHSAGGTNPSLVEMMHFGVPVVAYACEFNRLTTENKALYFSSVEELRSGLDKSNSGRTESMGRAMLEIANRRYRWEVVAKKYFDLFSEL